MERSLWEEIQSGINREGRWNKNNDKNTKTGRIYKNHWKRSGIGNRQNQDAKGKSSGQHRSKNDKVSGNGGYFMIYNEAWNTEPIPQDWENN